MILSNLYFQVLLVVMMAALFIFVGTRRNFGWLHLAKLIAVTVGLAINVYNLVLTQLGENVIVVTLVGYIAVFMTCCWFTLFVRVLRERVYKQTESKFNNDD